MKTSRRSPSIRALGRLTCSIAFAAACRRNPPSAPPPSSTVDASHATNALDAGAMRDVAVAPRDAGPPHVLTIRITNAGAAPMTILTNPDTNEILHTRHLFPRRNPDAGIGLAQEGELVKFFPVGQEPRCRDDAGAGYGGLGQPEPRTLAPSETIEFAWDGVQRREVIGSRGVCQDEGQPDNGRYRFEFDQPYNLPQCNRPIITWPLAPDAPRVLEIRCTPRPHPEGEEH
jgi:hypothetical protein